MLRLTFRASTCNYVSNGLEIVARLARGDLNMSNFSGFLICMQTSQVKFEGRGGCTSSYAQNLMFWSPTSFITLSRCSVLVPDLKFLVILRAVGCLCSRKQRKSGIYGGNSAQIAECVPAPSVCPALFSCLRRFSL